MKEKANEVNTRILGLSVFLIRQICQEFSTLMERALATPDEEFLNALKEVKKCTKNIIDSYTQPLGGLVEFAKVYPARVRDLLNNL